MKMSKRIRIWLYALGSLVALAGVCWGLLSSSWFQRALARRMIAALEGLTGCRVEVGQFRLRPLVFQIDLHDLILHGSEAPTEAPLLSARTVVVGLSPAQLLRRHIRLRELDWDYADLHLRVRADGSTNLPGPAARSPGDVALNEIMDLAIGRLTLAHTSVFWNDRRWPVNLEAQNLAILLRLGRGRRYVGSLASSALTLRSPRWSPPPFTLTSRFELTSGELAMSSLAWQSQAVSGRGSLAVRVSPTPDAHFSFEAEADMPALSRTLRLPAVQAGHLRMEGEGIYRQGEISAQGRVQAREVMLHEGSFSSGRFDTSAHFAVEHGKAELSNLAVSGWGGSAQGQVEIALRGPAPDFRLSARLRGLDLAAVLQSASPSPLLISYLHPASRIDGIAKATWTGGFESLNSEFGLDFRAAGLPPGLPARAGAPQGGAVSGQMLPLSGMIQGAVSLNPGLSLSIQEASFQFPHSALRAHGVLREPGLPSATTNKPSCPGRLQIDWKTSDFEEWRPLLEVLVAAPQPIPLSLISPAVFSGEVSGSPTAPQIRGRLEIGEFNFHHWKWNKLTASVVASADYVEIASGRVEHGASSFSLDASAHAAHWRLAPDSPVHLVARAEHTTLDNLKAAVGSEFPLSGYISGRLNLEGTPSRLAGEGTLRVEKGEIAGEPFDSLATHIRVAQAVWNLEDVQLAKGQGTMVGQASFDSSREYYSGWLKGANFSLAEFKRLALRALPSVTSPPGGGPSPAEGRLERRAGDTLLRPAGGPLEGRASFELRGQGTREEIQIHSTCYIQNIRLGGSPLGDFRAQLDSQGLRLLFQGEVRGAGGTLQISGEARPGEGWPVELAGQYTDLRVDPWIRLLLDSKFSAGVTAGGSFKLTGTFQDPNKFDLQGRAQLLEVTFPSSQWKNDQPVELHYASHVLSASRFRMRGPSTDLELGGSVRLGDPSMLSFDAQGMADATVLSLVDPGLQATGNAELKMHVSGTPSQPLLNGSVEIQGVNLRYGDLPFQLSGLKGTIRLEGQRATISSLRGMSGGGTITLGGAVTLAETPRFDLSADLEQARVRYPTDFTSLLNGNLRLEGTPERGFLHGELSVRQVVFTENVNWLTRMVEASNPFLEQPVGAPSPVASRIRLGVRVSSAPPVRIESQDLRLVADVDLRLQGTLASPAQVGTIHLVSGEAVFRGNRYKLNRGDINFTNPFRTQPTLDLEAQTRVQRYDLTLDISGPFDRLKLAYRSDPPLPTGDILSLLALGYSGREEEMSIAGARHASTSVGASALLSEALSRQVTGRIQRLFGVSRIKIDPNVSTPGYGSGARVTVEQQVTPDFTVTYVTNTAASQYRIIQVEWALSDKVSLLGIRDQNGVFGLELKFRQRFK
jgi:translocation and assembly module TamB